MAKAASAKVMKAAREHLSKMVGRFGIFCESPGVKALVRVESVNLETLEITLHCVSPVPKLFGDAPWQMGYLGPDMDRRFTIGADPTSVTADSWRNYMCWVELLEAGRGAEQEAELSEALFMEAARELYARFICPALDGEEGEVAFQPESNAMREARIAAEAERTPPIYAAFECRPEFGSAYRTRHFFWLPCTPPAEES
jgi:hypothetical protein